MKLGRLLRGVGAASLAALVSVPLAPGAASAAPAAPAAYAMVARAYPLHWAGSGSLPTVDLRVPYVSASTNHLPVVSVESFLGRADHHVTAMKGEDVAGLSCAGFDEQQCVDPFIPRADVGHGSADPVHREMVASFTGREGRFPGRIRALADCAGDCGHHLVRTAGDAAAPAGGAPGYISVGGSAAAQDLSIDDRGRLVSHARSELRDVVIGPHGEVRFSNLTATATATGAGAENSKGGKADLKINDFVILDNPVELTASGLRLASGAPSEQEAYDGAEALLAELADRGITLDLPSFDAQVERESDHVTVRVAGLRVRFDRTLSGPGVTAETVDQVIDLGSSTAVVAAFDTKRNVDVAFEGDEPTVTSSPSAPPPPAAEGGPGPTGGFAPAPPATVGPERTRPSTPRTSRPPSTRVNPPAPESPGTTDTAPDPDDPTVLPVTGVGEEPDDVLDDPSQTAIGVDDITRNLGLRDARSVSRAFGAFLGLGLILPLARFVIRRFG